MAELFQPSNCDWRIASSSAVFLSLGSRCTKTENKIWTAWHRSRGPGQFRAMPICMHMQDSFFKLTNVSKIITTEDLVKCRSFEKFSITSETVRPCLSLVLTIATAQVPSWVDLTPSSVTWKRETHCMGNCYFLSYNCDQTIVQIQEFI